MNHYYQNVPQIGNVAVSRHAQDRIRQDGITDREFEAALFEGELIPDTQGISFRDRGSVRIVIVHKPEPFQGAALIATGFRKLAYAKARR